MRLIFELNKNGITKILNGNLREIDRETFDDLESVDKLLVDPSHFVPYAIDEDWKAVEIAGFVIFFDDLENWQPYMDQIDLFDGEIVDPHQGIKDPAGWDKGLWVEYKTKDLDAEQILLTSPTGNFETSILSNYN